MVDKRVEHDFILMSVVAVVAVIAMFSLISPASLGDISITGNVIGEASAIPPPLCEDTDVGLDYSTKGRLSGDIPSGFYSEDRCFMKYFLREVYCKDNRAASHTTYCRTGCENGMCKEKKIQQKCGDGVLIGWERCDGANLGDKTCNSLGYIGGALSCTKSCILNTSGCTKPVCGNNIKEAYEVCDGNDLNNKTCRNFGFIGGTLKCSNCQYNMTSCVKTCSSDSECGVRVCAGVKVRETCENGRCVFKSSCTATKCAKEGEYASGTVAPEYRVSCCEGLKGFYPYPDRVGGGPLCYNPEKGTPVCKNQGTRSEGWYYPKTGTLLKYETCGGGVRCGNNICETGEADSCQTQCPPDRVCAAVCIIGTCPKDCANTVVCTDSDGGRDFNLKGTVKKIVDGKLMEVTDYCILEPSPEWPEKYNLVEYTCANTNENINSIFYTCPSGCRDGACVNTRCAKEGEYTSGTVAPEYQYGCCEGLRRFDQYSQVDIRYRPIGGGDLCYDPNKGDPICRNLGTSSEGWYYSRTGGLLKLGKCPTVTVGCGNGLIEPGEECDGYNLNGMTCSAFNFSGTVECTNCKLNLSKCTHAMRCNTYNDCLQIALAPDGYRECNGKDACKVGGGYLCENNTCVLHKRIYDCLNCTDGCLAVAYPIGAACVPPVNYCGNGMMNPGEQCDPAMPSISIQCSMISANFTSGIVTCDKNCKYNTANCVGPVGGRCGDGTVTVRNIEGFNEQCDGSVNNKTCRNFGFIMGTLTCYGCQYNTSRCSNEPRCGEGIKNLAEECDGMDLGGASCASLDFSSGSIRCASNCTIDKSHCLPYNYCGNRIVEAGEDCDGAANVTCRALDFAGGSIRCSLNCTFDTSHCLPYDYCGNYLVEPGEQCDGSTNTAITCGKFGFESSPGSVICRNCYYNTSRCTGHAVGACGDGALELGEQCDVGISRMMCADFGFTGGTISCNLQTCKYDTSKCVNGMPCNTNMDCPQIATIPEYMECYGSSLCRVGEGYDCVNSRCTLNKKYYDCTRCPNGCGNGACLPIPVSECTTATDCKVDPCGESMCMPVNEITLPCAVLPADKVADYCTCENNKCVGHKKPLPYCGDGFVNQAGEECDGIVSLPCPSHISFSGYPTGTLRCTNDCKFDYSNCTDNPPPTPRCGDGIIQKPNAVGFSEECDGDIFIEPLNICPHGSTGGPVSCKDCKWDYSLCKPIPEPRCGDGIRQTLLGENCDGPDFGGETCLSLGYAGGSLSCTSGCLIDTTGCTWPPSICGDGIVSKPNDNGVNEDCDTVVVGMGCPSEYYGGSVLCTRGCKYDYSNCTTVQPPRCGDGYVNTPNEQCDGGDLNGQSCVSRGFTRGDLACGGNCMFDESYCTTDTPPRCGDNFVNQDFEYCDGTDLNGNSCESRGFVSGTLRCTGSCAFDPRECSMCNNNGVCQPRTGETADNCMGDCFISPIGVALYLNPGSIDVATGDTVSFDIDVSNVNSLFGYQFDLNYDLELLEFIGLEDGDFLSTTQSRPFCVEYTASPGLVENVACTKLGGSGVSGNGLLKKVNFRALARGNPSNIVLSNVKLVDATAATISAQVLSGQVSIS